MSFIKIARDSCGMRGDRQTLHRTISPVAHGLKVEIRK